MNVATYAVYSVLIIGDNFILIYARMFMRCASGRGPVYICDCQLIVCNSSVVAGCGRRTSTLASSLEQTRDSVTEASRSLVHGSGTVCQQNCVSQTSNWWENFDGYWKRFCLLRHRRLVTLVFRAPWKYSATTTIILLLLQPPLLLLQLQIEVVEFELNGGVVIPGWDTCRWDEFVRRADQPPGHHTATDTWCLSQVNT